MILYARACALHAPAPAPAALWLSFHQRAGTNSLERLLIVLEDERLVEERHVERGVGRLEHEQIVVVGRGGARAWGQEFEEVSTPSSIGPYESCTFGSGAIGPARVLVFQVPSTTAESHSECDG
ncbi:hypothetical protein B0H11DRAFT_1906264 [Mycena galericulata]|nr:hypothetical protein B0H11DRAFT_1906264 [Mycena galericulata]